jgi:hypothetical protein
MGGDECAQRAQSINRFADNLEDFLEITSICDAAFQGFGIPRHEDRGRAIVGDKACLDAGQSFVVGFLKEAALLSSDFPTFLRKARGFSWNLFIAQRNLEYPLGAIGLFSYEVALAPRTAPEKLADLKSPALAVLDVIACLHWHTSRKWRRFA